MPEQLVARVQNGESSPVLADRAGGAQSRSDTDAVNSPATEEHEREAGGAVIEHALERCRTGERPDPHRDDLTLDDDGLTQLDGRDRRDPVGSRSAERTRVAM